jgi:putative acetyltransferase
MTDGAPGGVTVRAMRHPDRGEVLDLWVASWRLAYPSIDFDARRGWMTNRFDELERAGAQAHVAMDHSRIVGLVTIDPASGYLDQLVVAHTHRRRGVASVLLGEAQRVSPRRIELHVNQDNARAIAFYRKHGFAVSAEDANPLSGAPTYRMSWSGR